jgi:SAM-dependent methyltransferase
MKKSFLKELLDEEQIPEKDLIQNLKELAFINTYLGGHAVIKKGLGYFQNKSEAVAILEIGSGGGDNLAALKECFPHNSYTGLDMKATCINYSENRYPAFNWILSDYQLFSPAYKFDVIFNSLFCHHFLDEELIKMLKWMNENSAKGFFIGDLHRNGIAYYSIKILTFLFSKSYLVKNDAPLSVARGFTKSEWRVLLEKAGIINYQIKWQWAFRWLIVVKK